MGISYLCRLWGRINHSRRVPAHLFVISMRLQVKEVCVSAGTWALLREQDGPAGSDQGSGPRAGSEQHQGQLRGPWNHQDSLQRGGEHKHPRASGAAALPHLISLCLSSCGKMKPRWTTLRGSSASKGAASGSRRSSCCHACAGEDSAMVSLPQGRTGGGNRQRGGLFVFGGGLLHHGRDHHGDRRDGLPTLSPTFTSGRFQTCLV